MSLRKRIFIIVGATTVGLVVLLNLLTRVILLRSFDQLEQEHAYEQAQRALASLDNKLAALDTILVDWAAWDDTYAFVQDRNQEYIDSNLVDGTFLNTELDVMLFFDPEGRLVFGKAFDRDQEQEVPIPAALNDHLEPGDPLVSHSDVESVVNGIVMLPEGPMIVVSRAILTSEEKGPIGGTLVMGTYLNEAALQDLIKVTRLALSIHFLDDLELISDGEATDLIASGDQSILVRPQDKETVVAYALVHDIYKQPAIMVSIEMDRDIYQRGQMALLYTSAAVAAVGLVSGGVALWIVEHILLFRLTRLGRDMDRVGISGDATGRVAVVGDDELAILAQTVNTMLASLEQYQRRLGDSERQYRLLFEESPLTIEIYRLDGVLLQVNPAWEHVWNAPGYSAVGVYNILKDEQIIRLGMAPLFERAFTGEMVSLPDYEFDPVQSGLLGRKRWVRSQVYHLREEDGSLKNLVLLHEDITERKLTEQKLQESELLYRTLFENVPVGIELSTQEGRMLALNETMQRISGYLLADVEHIHSSDMYQRPEERLEIVDLALQKGMVRDVQVGLKRRDDTCYDASLTITPLRLGEQSVLMTVAEDITERKRAEATERELTAKLERARRMESLGTLAGGVAHDLNNILGPLVGYPELILLDLPADSPIRADVLQIQQSAELAATMVQDLLTLARRGAYQMIPLNLNTVIEEYLASPSFADLRARHPTVAVQVGLAPELMGILGSVPHLSKVVMNLAINAMEAMPYGGQLTIQTANQSLDQALVGYEYVDPGDYVVLRVMDTGMGIRAGDLGRIFEPFYTKKEMGRSGSGLGLSVVHGVVHDLKGKIDVRSELGVGAEFILYLPITYGEIVPPEQDRQIYGGTEMILVIDDLPSQRTLAVRMLSSLSYQVEAVGDGQAAVDYVQAHAVDILILDMILEGDMDGLDIYQRIVEYCPGQKAVIVSGFSETERVKELQRLGAGPFVKKPYTLADIGKAVRQELDHKRIG